MRSQQLIGTMLGVAGGLLLSFDIPLIRLALTDPFVFMVSRGLVLLITSLVIWRLMKERSGFPLKPLADPDFVLVGTCYGIGSIFFALAVFNTSTAKVVFILAFNPMIAAVLAWLLIGERPDRVTWLAIISTIFGVSLIVGDGLGGGTTFGDLMALGTALSLAIAIVSTRRSGKNLALAPAFGGTLSGLFALPLVVAYSAWPGDLKWLLVNLAIVIPFASFALALTPRYVPAPQTAMFYLLETVLAPIWVWYIFTEVPSERTLAGGTIVLVAILFHSAWQLQRERIAHRRAIV